LTSNQKNINVKTKETMEEMNEVSQNLGEYARKVRTRRRALNIGLAEARELGLIVPPRMVPKNK